MEALRLVPVHSKYPPLLLKHWLPQKFDAEHGQGVLVISSEVSPKEAATPHCVPSTLGGQVELLVSVGYTAHLRP